LLFLNWLSLAVFDPNAGGPYFIVQGYFLGSLFAHPILAAAWAAFGPGPLAWRIPLSLAWAVSLPSAVGVNVALNGGPRDAVVVVGVALLAQWLILQFPLWSLAMGFGLHLQHNDDLDGDANGGQIRFGIRHLLMIMLIVGVGLGIARIIVSNVRISGTREIAIFLFLAAAAIVLTLPLLFSVLMRRLAGPGLILAILFMVIATASEAPVLNLIDTSGPKMSDLAAINIGTAALVLVITLVVRLNGYCFYARARGIT
jgi:hypothetical protein